MQHRRNNVVSISLPFELERIIFEIAAREGHSRGGGYRDILLVCNRVKEWVEAIIYESVVLDVPLLTSRLLLRTLSSKAGRHQFFERTVKRVYLGPIVTAEEAVLVLSMCTGATEIVSWAPELGAGAMLDYIGRNSALKRLAVRSNDIFGQCKTTVDTCASFSSPGSHASGAVILAQLLSNITHLCIINPPEPANFVAAKACSENIHPADYDALLHMPSLTHLVFGKLWIRPHRILFHFFDHMLSRPSEGLGGDNTTTCLQSFLLISSEKSFINHATKWHQCDLASDSRLIIGKEYDYESMARLGWIHKK